MPSKTPPSTRRSCSEPKNARTLGGHLLHAVTSPNVELFVTSYPTALEKRPVAGKGFDRIDPTLGED